MKADQRQRNRYLGGDVPFGFEVKDGELPVAREQAAIRRMIKLRSKGTSLREIAAAMKRDGFELSHYGVDKIIAGTEASPGRKDAPSRPSGSP
jgi:putative DNA-invertase from lambdoid prophage Rac